MKLRNIPLIIKILASIITFPIFIMIWIIACALDKEKALKNATQAPNEKTVTELLSTWNRIKLGVNNHPDNWKKLRDSWYRINGSDKVPTHLKQQVIDLFLKEGLYLSNTRVINNYKQG